MRASLCWLILGLALLRATAIAAPAGDPGRRAPSPADDGADDLAAADRASDAGDLVGPSIAARGPAVGAVLTAAYAAAGFAHDPQDSWIRRARLAGLVPWITVRTTHDTSWQDESSAVGHSTGLEVRATWRLDRLLFDAKELQVAALETARRRERRRLAARVIRAYFTWRRAASIASDDERVITRVAEATAELDALTDGWFSDQLSPRRRPTGSAKP
jgi:outer membrane protein TolC